ncbi:MAG: CRISPR-associated protein Csx20 [Candidatus Cloacimonadales bacterium]|jgi:hypothetical protein|nr:CRISPR-associated protein Csx20 [Candidatus Cloacimonadota bacterium]MDX9977350.1 CRISPR-associated protein Csx20 [Candidatus Cloacimonadales bacterium]
MPNLVLLFSHQLSRDQIADAEKSMLINEYIMMPNELKELWANVSPEVEKPNIKPFTSWLESITKEGDYILIQGDYYMTYHMVQWAFHNNRIPVYATTKRETIIKQVEATNEVIKTSVFKHVIFRKY